ncbi:MAG: HoxN/HupN/NixA family nickel/cobalt transporter [Nitrososphaerota archaeon]
MIEELIQQLPTATPFFVLATGFLLGLLHAFEPDHVAAVATQNSKLSQRSLTRFRQIGSGALKSSILGALWGAGHTSALVLVSLLIFVFSMSIPDEIFGNFEFGVGVMLVVLGFFTYRNRGLMGQKHVHTHTHDDIVHTHPHVHDKTHSHGHKSYIIGCIHGLAGSGSLVVLALSALHNLENILSFIMVFGIGSILGMMLVSSAIGLPFSLTIHSERINKILRYSVASICIMIGIDILYSIITSGSFFGLNIS